MDAICRECIRVMRFDVVAGASAAKSCFRQFYAWTLIGGAIASPGQRAYNRPHNETATWGNPQYLVALPGGVPTRGVWRHFRRGMDEARCGLLAAKNEANTEV